MSHTRERTLPRRAGAPPSPSDSSEALLCEALASGPASGKGTRSAESAGSSTCERGQLVLCWWGRTGWCAQSMQAWRESKAHPLLTPWVQASRAIPDMPTTTLMLQCSNGPQTPSLDIPDGLTLPSSSASWCCADPPSISPLCRAPQSRVGRSRSRPTAERKTPPRHQVAARRAVPQKSSRRCRGSCGWLDRGQGHWCGGMHKGGGSSFLVAWVCRTSISSSQAHMRANVRLMKLPAVRQVAPRRLHSLGLWWERCQGIGLALGFGDTQIVRQVL